MVEIVGHVKVHLLQPKMAGAERAQEVFLGRVSVWNVACVGETEVGIREALPDRAGGLGWSLQVWESRQRSQLSRHRLELWRQNRYTPSQRPG